jgi:anti-sigma B factor antagonist
MRPGQKRRDLLRFPVPAGVLLAAGSPLHLYCARLRRCVMADLKASILEKGDVMVLELTGPVTLGAGDLKVRSTVKELVAKGCKKVVIDLGGVPHVDSTGIGELVSAYTSARAQGAKLVLAHMTKHIKDLMDIAQLSAVFEHYESQEAAVKALG